MPTRPGARACASLIRQCPVSATSSARRDLAVNLTLRELRGRYKRSVLGWTWSLLNPLATVAIYSLVFSFFLKVQPPVGKPSGLKSFALFLLCGLVPWNFFQNGLNMGLGSLVSNGNLIKKVYFPRSCSWRPPSGRSTSRCSSSWVS